MVVANVVLASYRKQALNSQMVRCDVQTSRDHLEIDGCQVCVARSQVLSAIATATATPVMVASLAGTIVTS